MMPVRRERNFQKNKYILFFLNINTYLCGETFGKRVKFTYCRATVNITPPQLVGVVIKSDTEVVETPPLVAFARKVRLSKISDDLSW